MIRESKISSSNLHAGNVNERASGTLMDSEWTASPGNEIIP